MRFLFVLASLTLGLSTLTLASDTPQGERFDAAFFARRLAAVRAVPLSESDQKALQFYENAHALIDDTGIVKSTLDASGTVVTYGTEAEQNALRAGTLDLLNLYRAVVIPVVPGNPCLIENTNKDSGVPTEVWVDILRHLPPQDIINVALVNHFSYHQALEQFFRLGDEQHLLGRFLDLSKYTPELKALTKLAVQASYYGDYLSEARRVFSHINGRLAMVSGNYYNPKPPLRWHFSSLVCSPMENTIGYWLDYHYQAPFDFPAMAMGKLTEFRLLKHAHASQKLNYNITDILRKIPRLQAFNGQGCQFEGEFSPVAHFLIDLVGWDFVNRTLRSTINRQCCVHPEEAGGEIL